MLDTKTFKTVIENTPLVSIDLCLVCDGQVLLGKRNNDPLKGEWFTPGGRIRKNETWQDALLRIAEAELGLSGIAVEDCDLMGMWDHFYNNSALDENTSTDIFQKSMPTVYFGYDVNRRRSFKVLERHAIFNSSGNRVLSEGK